MLKALFVALFFVVTGVSTTSGRGVMAAASGTAQLSGSPLDAAPESGSLRGTMESCDGLPLVDKEACYAQEAPELLAECERMRPNRCAPYAQMHVLEKQTERLSAELLHAARKAYTSYENGQPGYVRDVEKSLELAYRTWREYRDAHCGMQPFIHGMSRNEAADLIEVCRADATRGRVKEITDMISALKQATGDGQPGQ